MVHGCGRNHTGDVRTTGVCKEKWEAGLVATSREHYVAGSMAGSETVVLLLRIGVPWPLVQQDLQRCGEKKEAS